MEQPVARNGQILNGIGFHAIAKPCKIAMISWRRMPAGRSARSRRGRRDDYVTRARRYGSKPESAKIPSGQNILLNFSPVGNPDQNKLPDLLRPEAFRPKVGHALDWPRPIGRSPGAFPNNWPRPSERSWKAFRGLMIRTAMDAMPLLRPRSRIRGVRVSGP